MSASMVNHPVFSALLPVVLLIAIGLIAARADWISAGATKDLSNLVFMVLTPALLFRAMSTVQVQQLNFRPIALYFVAAGLLYALVFWLWGSSTRSAVLALGATFSNTVMIGIALVGLAYGQAALVLLLTLISVHALILLTAATIVLELTRAREQIGTGAQAPAASGAWHTVWAALKGGVVHPVPLPILLGLLFAQTGLVLPEVLDRPLQLLGSAFGPMALLLVGASLARVAIGAQWRAALALAALKNLALPLLVAGLGRLWGLTGLDWTVMVLAAALPMGANVFLFAQRYQVAQDLVTASMALSTALGLVSITLVMAGLDWLA